MDNITYPPQPMITWTPLSGGADYAMVSRLLDQWVADGRRSRIGDWTLTLWCVDDGAVTWISVEDMSCPAPDHEPRSFDLLPTIDFAQRGRKPTMYKGARGYLDAFQNLARDTWYLCEFTTQPAAWLAEVRHIANLGLWLAAVIDYGTGHVRGWAASTERLPDADLVMAAVDRGIGTHAFPDLLVVPSLGRGLHTEIAQRVADITKECRVISLSPFRGEGAVARVNLGIRKLVACGRAFLLA